MQPLILLMLFASSERTVAGSPVVSTSDPSVVTHKLKLDEITIGFSDQGGSYLNYLDLGDGKNIVSVRMLKAKLR
jgi:hypothetical protein